MKKVNYLLVSNLTYHNFISENKKDRLDKFLKIYTFERFINTDLLEESFDKLYSNTKYNIEPYTFSANLSNYEDTSGYKIWFETDSKNKYRIDLIPLKNFNSKINSDFVWSISFTLDKYDVGDAEYEDLTNLHETKEVLLRTGDILNRVNIPKNFVIGNTELQKKIDLYKNIILFVFKNYNITMDICLGFKDNKALYIWI